MIDGGAVLTIVPPTPEELARSLNDIKLHAANGSPIACYAIKDMDINLGQQTFPILGSDFFG